MTTELRQQMFALELPDDARLGAVAAEASIGDAELDELERALRAPDLDVHARLGAAFRVARAGRRRSGPALAELRRDLASAGRADEAKVALAALDVLALRPPPRLERADRGYRWRDQEVELYIEDPLAEHWHAAGRWGPPLRPDLERPPRFFGAFADPRELAAFAADGGVVVVTFAPRPGWRTAPRALRLTRAGFARDAALTTMIRWSELRSVGWMDDGHARSVAYELRGEREEGLPSGPSCGDEALMRSFESLLQTARKSHPRVHMG